MTAGEDWVSRIAPQAARREALAWPVAALLVAGLATAAAVMLVRAEARSGRAAALDRAVFLDLDAGAGPPAALALPEPAPDVPMTAAPNRPMPPPKPEAVAHPPAETLPPETPHLAALPAPPKATPPPKERKKPAARSRAKAAVPAAAPSSKAAPAPAPSAAGTAPKGAEASLKARWGSQIRARIQSHAQGADGAAGKVGLRLTITRSGGLAAAFVARSSGNPVLDRLALRAAKTAGPFPAAPAGLSGASFGFALAVAFRD